MSDFCLPDSPKSARAELKVDKISKSNVLTVIEQVMSGTAFGKITAVYGQIDENWEFVRKWPARKIPITDKMVKNSCLSVKIQPFRTRIYGQMLRKAVFVRKSSS
ncbi:hypothetical protein GKC97_08340 [Lactobacillus ruminis]|uniref:hypothetical protein n=1 Tax=Ligilactobacillus ruminis TaxID=1623 RepID=UPI0012AF8368|nr:hypothetical protein [Ligilactobacillus ruminis]MSB54944.1 hypothetical protein [Ligilactobacillus ruminis]MSB91630.1 hypothetical protein [Ligilactobacillus ruminis]